MSEKEKKKLKKLKAAQIDSSEEDEEGLLIKLFVPQIHHAVCFLQNTDLFCICSQMMKILCERS